jgi:hypothetical protein
VDVGAILLGSGLTLAATTVAQLYVIPRYLARTRGRERWEQQVVDLAALLEEQLPRAIDRYRAAASDVRMVGELRGDDDYDQAKVEAALADAGTEARLANGALGEQMARLQSLTTHARQVNPDAAYWDELALRHHELRASLSDFDGHQPGRPDLDHEQWAKAWDTVDQARRQMLETVNQIAARVPMKPPPHRPSPVLDRVTQNLRNGARSPDQPGATPVS